MAMPAWPRLVYSAALYLLSPLIVWRIWREQVPTYSRWQRLGVHLGRLPVSPRIWLHCASVGEVRAARPLIEGLLARHPEHSLLLTTMTATGAQQAKALINEQQASDYERIAHCFLPLDFPGAAKRFIKRAEPVLAIMFETELWPNLVHACHQQAVPLTLVNGRLSPRAFKRYQHIRLLMASTLARITWLAAKSSEDAGRFEALGCPADVIQVVGSLKFEFFPQEKALEEGKRLHHSWGERPVWVAGSTRGGEENMLLEAHRQLCARLPSALLILVPRHPQRFDEVANLCVDSGWEVSRRSQQQEVTEHTQVYLGDTLGELAQWYAAGNVAYVGGSLVPFGGHNVLEPAALAKPVLCGPSLENFSDVVEPLLAAGALKVVESPEELASALAGYLSDPPYAEHVGVTGKATIETQRGALARTLDGLRRWLT